MVLWGPWSGPFDFHRKKRYENSVLTKIEQTHHLVTWELTIQNLFQTFLERFHLDQKMCWNYFWRPLRKNGDLLCNTNIIVKFYRHEKWKHTTTKLYKIINCMCKCGSKLFCFFAPHSKISVYLTQTNNFLIFAEHTKIKPNLGFHTNRRKSKYYRNFKNLWVFVA